MIVKNLLIVGMFGLLAMGEAKAAGDESKVPLTPALAAEKGDGNIRLAAYCDGHRCYYHHRWHHPPYWHHDDYGYWRHHCYRHPWRPGCERWCDLNPDECVP